MFDSTHSKKVFQSELMLRRIELGSKPRVYLATAGHTSGLRTRR
jgi:hypothetical protein